MKNAKYFLLVFILFSWLHPSFGQSPMKKDSIVKPYKAAIYGYGGFGVLFFAAGVNAQYKIRQFDSFDQSGLWLNAGIGVSAGINHSARSASLKIDFLNGKNNNYFELSGGILVGSYSTQAQDSEEVRFYPDVNIGYRYQKERKPYFVRLGIGYPEYIYASLGVSLW
jgi:hypothetical protein